jgi:transcription elongation factor Elf1
MAEKKQGKLVSQRDYVRDMGSYCPRCRSNDIYGGSIDVDSGGASLTVLCNDCGASWTDQYKLIGYSDFEEG